MGERFGILSPGTGEQRLNRGGLFLSELRVFYFGFIEAITKEVINRYRFFFESNVCIPAEVRYVFELDENGERCDTDQDATGIHISATYHDKERFFPSILVSDVSGNILDLYLARKMGSLVINNPAFDIAIDPDEDTCDPEKPPEILEIGERLGGKINVTVTLQIEAYQRPELDQICDLALYALIGPIKRKLRQKGYIWLPNQGSVSGISEVEYTTGQPVLRRTIGFGLQSEWYDDFFFEGITVEAVNDETLTLITADSLQS